MKRLRKSILFSLTLLLLSSCANKEEATTISVKNTLNVERTFETIELTKSFLKVEDLSTTGILNTETKKLELTQTVDNDSDGVLDVILFQPKIKANSEVNFKIVTVKKTEKPTAPELCFSRFVPERTDDYTWENDKVAFRVYGPTAQKMIEDSIPGGTLSSGVDAWLKKVDYPIINKWYKKETETDGTYHEDTGEGLDNFHVGISRGVGGIGIKQDSTYCFSKNYSEWKTLTTGPIRTSFYLNYEDWDANGNKIIESKVISLDLGNNLSKFKTSIQGSNTISAGLTLHEKDGNVTGSNGNGWVSYWQPHGESELGTAILAPKSTFIAYETYTSETKDLNNAYAKLKVENNEVIYYAGFGWKESGQFKNKKDWEDYLNKFSQQINNPLQVKVLNR
ncbi:DUF4861 family protein [Maribacter sp.]|uniref:DUF4861 family protein n=1 Tax=Maribacter sp. TaxID=1897614 RepID=UPI0025BBBD87|nr:DUF4861 family protein [Maribacter sp.]